MDTLYLKNQEDIQRYVTVFSSAVKDAWSTHSTTKKITKHSKEWWNEQCSVCINKYHESGDTANWKAFKAAVQNAKRIFFNQKIQEIASSNKRPWNLMNWVKKKNLPAIEAIYHEEQPCNNLKALWNALHSLYNSADNRAINTRFLDGINQCNDIDWPPFTSQEFKEAIAKCSNASSLGPDHVTWRHLKPLILDKMCLSKVVDITNACITVGYWPDQFKESTSVIIPKPNKTLYNTPKAFQPIVLLNTIGKLIEKVISNRLHFHLSANGFLDPNQLGGIRQRSTIDAGIYLMHLIHAGWMKKCHTSVIAFDIAQFFPLLNHDFLSLCLTKAGLNANILKFFINYHSNRSMTYTWNNFTSQKFTTSIGIDQGSTLSPILSAIYLTPIIKTFKKRIKNLKKEIYADILLFVDDSLLISQEKSYDLSSAFLFSSYNMILKILTDVGLVMEHNKSEIFHFTRAQNPPNPSLDLISIGGSILHPKPIWRYLGFFFNRKLNFHQHVHHYATKCISTLNTMKILGNSSRGLLLTQKRLLYRTCIVPIALYGFQLWFFKGAPTVKNIAELKKMQRRAALWITGAFRTSPTEGVEAIAGLMPINLHLKKLNGRHHLRYATIPPSHAINSLLDIHQNKNQIQHKFALVSLTDKQKLKLRSPIKDVSKRLNEIKDKFDPFHSIFHSGLRLVDHSSDRIIFHSPDSSKDKDLFNYLSKLNLAFEETQKSSKGIAIISDGSVKTSGSATAIAHIWRDNKVTNRLKMHTSVTNFIWP